MIAGCQRSNCLMTHRQQGETLGLHADETTVTQTVFLYKYNVRLWANSTAGRGDRGRVNPRRHSVSHSVQSRDLTAHHCWTTCCCRPTWTISLILV